MPYRLDIDMKTEYTHVETVEADAEYRLYRHEDGSYTTELYVGGVLIKDWSGKRLPEKKI